MALALGLVSAAAGLAFAGPEGTTTAIEQPDAVATPKIPEPKPSTCGGTYPTCGHDEDCDDGDVCIDAAGGCYCHGAKNPLPRGPIPH